MRDDNGQQRQRRVEQCRGAIDHTAHCRVDRANHRVRRDERSEPVRKVNDLGGGNAWKQVLRAAREACDLVRKHRPADKYVVVLGGQTVQRNRHVLIEASAGDIGNVARRDRPEACVCGGVVPTVIEDAARAGAAIDHRPPDVRSQLRVVHGRVRAERDEKIERRDARTELAFDQLEHQRHRHRPRAVWNNHEHPASVDGQRAEPVARNGIELVRAQIAVRHALANRSHSLAIVMQSPPGNRTLPLK